MLPTVAFDCCIAADLSKRSQDTPLKSGWYILCTDEFVLIDSGFVSVGMIFAYVSCATRCYRSFAGE
jgi:hypothetical protein